MEAQQTDEKVAATKPAETLAATEVKSEPVLTDATPAANATEVAASEKNQNVEPFAITTNEAVKLESAATPTTTDGTASAAPAATEGNATAIKTEDAEKKDDPVKVEEPAIKAEETEESAKPAEAAVTLAATSPVWPDLTEDHPINKLLRFLPELIQNASDYNEVYGIYLNPAGPFHTKLILQKFLRANANNVEKAKEQLQETLKWRQAFKPLAAIDDTFDKERYEGLGYVIEAEGVPGSVNTKDIITFNIYGAVKDNKATFGDVDSFLRWRVALMEMGIKKLNLTTAAVPIPDYGKGPDPYQGIQVHDYLSVSFIRQDPNVKAASRKTIDVFSKVYPETLSRKFFVNVPAVMGWVFSAFKLILPKETVKKFSVLSYGNQLAAELGNAVPEVYGGKAGPLETIGVQTNF